MIYGFAMAIGIAVVVYAMTFPELNAVAKWNDRVATRVQQDMSDLSARIKAQEGESSDEPPLKLSMGVATGLQIRKTQAVYPDAAKGARIQGKVILRIFVNREGAVQHAEVISGHPLLAPSALEAIKEWKYKPYLLNGEPRSFESEAIIIFSLAGGDN
jgi:TonB family protein